ncbi:unnamed protein product [Polarella glacialis]|uniref:Uncharacterized protein n=1 Tax=Polarella glacialis TaxID=89957 RepID=A0A813IS89_POLGL|nr:unnamed protein product [Polarella glacialis]
MSKVRDLISSMEQKPHFSSSAEAKLLPSAEAELLLRGVEVSRPPQAKCCSCAFGVARLLWGRPEPQQSNNSTDSNNNSNNSNNKNSKRTEILPAEQGNPNSNNSNQQQQQQQQQNKGVLVQGLIASLATAESRQKHREQEEARQQESLQVALPLALEAPPVEAIGPGAWRVRGLYEHQVLKLGLQLLDRRWADEAREALLQFSRSTIGAPALFRETLLRDLLTGKLRLQSVLANDLAAAQSDLKRLSLLQLLRLRTLHIDFTPSGCGSDNCLNSVGAVHGTFLGAVDSLLFRELGRKAVAGGGANCLVEDHYRFGREAVFFAAAAAAVPSPTGWCWWLCNGEKLFFDAQAFSSSSSFPGDGVLEVQDLSRADRHDPTGAAAEPGAEESEPRAESVRCPVSCEQSWWRDGWRHLSRGN